MSSDGYLAPPDEKPANAELWIQTWNTLDRFLPGLLSELFPEEAKKPRMVRKPTGVTSGSISVTDSGDEKNKDTQSATSSGSSAGSKGLQDEKEAAG